MRAFVALSLPILAACVPQEVLVADDSCASDGGSDCALNELQMRKTGNNRGNWSKGFAFPGGGFKAQTQSAGVLAGMMAALAQRQGGNDAATLTNLFSSFDSFMSVSGGGWFFSSLAYSPFYKDTVEGCAKTPEDAVEIYNRRWSDLMTDFKSEGPTSAVSLVQTNDTAVASMDRLKEMERDYAATRDGANPNPLADTPLKDVWGYMEELSPIVNAATVGRVDWYTYTGSFLWKTANIGPDRMMGGEVNDFAKNKLYLVGVTIPTPGNGAFKGHSVYPFETDLNTIAYKARSSTEEFKNLPLYIPAKYSIVMGTGIGAQAQFPFCASPTCHDVYLEYSVSSKVPFYHRTVNSPPIGPDFRKQFGSATGTLLIQNVIASSSAACSPTVMIPGLSGFSTQVTAYTAKSVHPYMKASLLLAQAKGRGDVGIWRSAKMFAEYSLIPIADGYLSDNTCMINGMAAGITEFVVNLIMGYTGIVGLGSDRAALSKSIGLHDMPMFLGQVFPVIEMTATELYHRYNNLHKLQMPSDDFLCLHQLNWGSLNSVTVANPWVGVPAGMNITIHMFQPDSVASIGGDSNYDMYGHCVSEIIQTIIAPVNAAATDKILLDFFDVAAVPATPAPTI